MLGGLLTQFLVVFNQSVFRVYAPSPPATPVVYNSCATFTLMSPNTKFLHTNKHIFFLSITFIFVRCFHSTLRILAIALRLKTLSFYSQNVLLPKGGILCSTTSTLMSPYNVHPLITFPFLVTGNANFNMEQTTFTLVGFTQPHTAMPIIQDTQNNAKGFTSRFLWFFPEPVYCRMRDTVLTEEESSQITDFKKKLGSSHLLYILYIPVIVPIS